jgi:DNA polymerase-3 subunit epsilon
VLDVETTSTDPYEARVVQVALALVYGDGSVAKTSWTTLVDPGVTIPAEATAVHGITNETASQRGMRPEMALVELVVRLNQLYVAEWPLVIYNAPYDWRVVLEEAKRYDLVVAGTPSIVDPLLLDRVLDKYRKGSRKLADVAIHYGLTVQGAHDARGDAIASAGIVREMMVRYPKLAAWTPAQLHQAQVGWYAAWRDDFNGYQAGPKGKGYHVDGEWPA